MYPNYVCFVYTMCISKKRFQNYQHRSSNGLFWFGLALVASVGWWFGCKCRCDLILSQVLVGLVCLVGRRLVVSVGVGVVWQVQLG